MKNGGKNGKLGSKIQVVTRAWKTLNRFCFFSSQDKKNK